jgi:ergothioneine biosynthesis protein EgtB
MSSLAVDRSSAVDWYQRNRARTRAIFDLIDPSTYYSRPIALRNPIVFYEGHLPAFSVISFLRRGLGRPPVDARLETLFERGIDPDSTETAAPRSGANTAWPSRDEVIDFGRRVDAAIIEALEDAELRNDRPAMHRAEALYTALEHEAMHQETLLYMWHRLPFDRKNKPPDLAGAGLHAGSGETSPKPVRGEGPVVGDAGSGIRHRTQSTERVRIPSGIATLGADRHAIPFGWDNEFDEHRVDVPAFDIDVDNVTNAQFLEFVEAGGYRDRSLWSDEQWTWIQESRMTHPSFWSAPEGATASRSWIGMFEKIPLPPEWPVYVSHAEAEAYARWKGRRLPTEPEYHRAAFGSPSGHEQSHPWGETPPVPEYGNFDFARFEPVPVGSSPAGQSAWGVHDLVGNGWEWTATRFAPFPGFQPMPSYPEYSADFFDGQHYVMKGASPATAKELIRRSFRNWFRPNYPYVYATFRTVK